MFRTALATIAAAAILAATPAGRADEMRLDLAKSDAMSSLEVRGDASIDTARDSGDGDGSLKVAPGAQVVWKLRDADGAGMVRFKVYDDGAAPADAKKRHAGPHWGVVNAEGRVLAAGAIYAPYLNGAKTYASIAYTPGKKGDSFLSAVQYLGIQRKPSWHEWTFDFDPANGVRILYDGKDVNARRERFKWAKAAIRGFAGVALIGDTDKAGGQTIWVDALSATTDARMLAAPPTPTPVPPIVPESDPAPERQIALVKAVRGQHPRLLFGPDDVKALREKAKNNAPFYDEMLNYAGGATAPTSPKFQKNATDAQRQGLWRLPSVALQYLSTGDKGALERAEGFLRLFLRLDHWETGKEMDSGMGAANIAAGAALAYDMLYNDLDADLRDKFAEKLFLQARRQYYGGHLKRNPGSHYWQNDPQNNHRYHRNAGLALSTLAVCDKVEGADWLLAKVADELAFIHKWLPEDGTCHESPTYEMFGFSYLLMAMTASDRCLGTDYLKHRYFREAPLFQLSSYTPDFKQLFAYGDSNIGGLSGYTVALLGATRANRLADAQAGLMDMNRVRPKGFFPAWMGFLWHDPTLTGGSIDKLPTFGFYPDMGIVRARESWKPGAASMAFKCGPYGGHLLNEFRRESNGTYINVAHDDPDANSFLLATSKGMVVLPDGYSKKKLTAAQNTILVNGKGQKGEGKGWSQPLKRVDMATLANMVSVRTGEGGRSVAEGEAGGMYTALATYRRAVAWMPGDYVLVFDRIAAKSGAPEIAWLAQSKMVSPSQGGFRLTANAAMVDVAFAANVPMASAVVDSPAQTKGKPLGLKQIRLSAKTGNWISAAAFDVWKKGVKVSVDATDDGATVRIEGAHGTDEWQWAFGNGKTAMLQSVSREGKALEWGTNGCVPVI